MKRRSLSIATVIGFACTTLVVSASTASAHPTVNAGPLVTPPASLSTSGDYATDVLGDPWDFSQQGDVPPYQTLGAEAADGISWDGNAGVLNVAGHGGTVVKLVRNFGAVLPWGHDGLLHPVDANVYNKLSFHANFSTNRQVGIRFWTEAGFIGTAFLPTGDGAHAGRRHVRVRPRRRTRLVGQDRSCRSAVRLRDRWRTRQLQRQHRLGTAAPHRGADRAADVADRAHARRRASRVAPTTPPTTVIRGTSPGPTTSPAPTTSPTCRSTATPTTAKPSAMTRMSCLPLRTPLNTDKYHRFTADVCYDGGFALTGAPGGGMNARVIWFDEGGQALEDSQDIIVEPGCNRMTFDMATDPAIAVDDDTTAVKAGWRGLKISYLRFDLNEDPGVRSFSLRDIRLADDAAFSSGTYPISFDSSTSGRAQLFVTTDRGSFNGTPIGTMSVVAGHQHLQLGRRQPSQRHLLGVRHRHVVARSRHRLLDRSRAHRASGAAARPAATCR